MPVFVGGDQLADLLQDGFGGRLAQRGIVAGGAGFDHASGDKFTCAGPSDRRVGIGLDGIASSISVERRGVIPLRIGQFSPFGQSVAVLHLFFGPIVGCLAEIGIIVEHAAQIQGIVAPITLDHRRGFHQRHERGVHGRGIERVPGDIFDPPMFHLGVTPVGSNRGGASAPRSTIYAYRTWRETCVALTLGRLCYSATLAFDPQGGLQRQVPGSSPYAEERTVEFERSSLHNRRPLRHDALASLGWDRVSRSSDGACTT